MSSGTLWAKGQKTLFRRFKNIWLVQECGVKSVSQRNHRVQLSRSLRVEPSHSFHNYRDYSIDSSLELLDTLLFRSFHNQNEEVSPKQWSSHYGSSHWAYRVVTRVFPPKVQNSDRKCRVLYRIRLLSEKQSKLRFFSSSHRGVFVKRVSILSLWNFRECTLRCLEYCVYIETRKFSSEALSGLITTEASFN